MSYFYLLRAIAVSFQSSCLLSWTEADCVTMATLPPSPGRQAPTYTSTLFMALSLQHFAFNHKLLLISVFFPQFVFSAVSLPYTLTGCSTRRENLQHCLVQGVFPSNCHQMLARSGTSDYWSFLILACYCRVFRKKSAMR